MISEAKLRAAIAGNLAGFSPDLVKAMESRAVAFLQTATSRYLGPVEALTEFLRGNGTDYLVLGDVAWPTDLEDYLAVSERTRPGAVATELDATAFELRSMQRGSVLARLDELGWQWGWEYAVTYRRGYATDAGPREIEQIVIDLVALRVSLLGHMGMRSESIGGYSYTRFGEGDLDSLDGAREVIAAWRAPVFA